QTNSTTVVMTQPGAAPNAAPRMWSSGICNCLDDCSSTDKFKMDDRDESINSPQPVSKETESLRLMKKELQTMQDEENRKEEIAKERYQRSVKAERKRIEAEELAKGIHCNPGVKEVREAIKDINEGERKFAMQRKLDELDKETEAIQDKIDAKYGVFFSKDKEKPNLNDLAEGFFTLPGNSNLPSDVTSTLTHSEISDLREVFDLFDVKGKGYINANDLKRLINMLGFRASKEVFDGMIAEIAGDDKTKVSFQNFLQFVVRSQGEGPDPFEDIKQAFDTLDIKDQGFLTLDDLRMASEDCNLKFSNRVLREMIQEADKSGDGKITFPEFTAIMLQTSSFKMS
ncbi:hypothetical protein FSP39_006925, partial [Pinctada imbricata]